MKNIATYTSLATGLSTAWDFVGDPNDDTSTRDVWNIGTLNNGDPCLTWQQGCVPAADDGDGVLAAIEQAAPNSGDGNNDGVQDGEQANVTSYVNPVTGKYVTLAVSSSCSIQATNVAAAASNATTDTGYTYPAGMMNFTLDCGTAGATATVTQYYFGTSGSFVARKFNGTSYQTIAGATIADQTIGGQAAKVLSYQVTDGSALDTDGVANGVIIDPAGLASAATINLAATGVNTLPLAALGVLAIATSGVIVVRTLRQKS